MKKKLTLTVDDSVLKRAKAYAAKQGMSVSEIVEKYLDENTAEEEGWMPEPKSWVSEILGSARLSKEDQEKSYKEIREEEITKKFG